MPSSIELTSGPLMVRFDWAGDRYRHLVLIDGETVITSVEGDGVDTNPPSPPMQDLSLEDLGGGRLAIMGVGRAGRGHWSVSVVATEECGLLLEWACRGDVAKLGNHYHIDGDTVALIARPTAVVQSSVPLVVRPVERLVGTSVWSYEFRSQAAMDK